MGGWVGGARDSRESAVCESLLAAYPSLQGEPCSRAGGRWCWPPAPRKSANEAPAGPPSGAAGACTWQTRPWPWRHAAALPPWAARSATPPPPRAVCDRRVADCHGAEGCMGVQTLLPPQGVLLDCSSGGGGGGVGGRRGCRVQSGAAALGRTYGSEAPVRPLKGDQALGAQMCCEACQDILLQRRADAGGRVSAGRAGGRE